MTLFGYNEAGELVFTSEPFEFDADAHDAFEAQKANMVINGVFHLSLERTYLPLTHRNRFEMSAAR